MMKFKFLLTIFAILLLAITPLVYAFADDGPEGPWPDQALYISSLTASSDIIQQGGSQTFSVEVREDLFYQPVSFVLVEVMYMIITEDGLTNDYSAGICYTNILGLCDITAQFDIPGDYIVYATAMRYGYTPDADLYPFVTFTVQSAPAAVNHAPEIIPPIDNVTVHVGETIIFDLADNEYDEDGDSLTWSLGDYSSDLIDAGLSGQELRVDANQIGNAYVDVILTDEHGAYDSQRVYITIIEAPVENHAPVIALPDLTLAEDSGVTINLNDYAYDEDGDSLLFSIVAEPDTNIVDYDLSGSTLILEADDAGLTSIEIEVSDGELTSSDIMTIEVISNGHQNKTAPYFTSIPITTAIKDEWYEYEVEAVDPEGTDVTYYLLEKPSGMKMDSEDGEIRWLPESNGEFDVIIMAVDEDDYFALQRFTITVIDADDGVSFNVNNLIISRIRISTNEYLSPGDELILSMRLDNEGRENLDDIKVTAHVQELGLRKSTGYFTLKKGDAISKTLILEIPEYAEQGNYAIRIEVYSNGVKRIIYRDFFISG